MPRVRTSRSTVACTWVDQAQAVFNHSVQTRPLWRVCHFGTEKGLPEPQPGAALTLLA